MSDEFPPFQFGEAKAGPGGCCGKPVGCTSTSQGCIHKVEKKAWQERARAYSAEHPENSTAAIIAKQEKELGS